VLSEHLLFRRRAGYNMSAWDTPSMLPPGIAAIVSWACEITAAFTSAKPHILDETIYLLYSQMPSNNEESKFIIKASHPTSRSNNALNVIQSSCLNPADRLISISAHVCLSISCRSQHALTPFQSHIRHAQNLSSQILEAMRSVIVISVAVEAEFVVHHELMISVDGIVETVKSVRP
jgi:hypothetical protein